MTPTFPTDSVTLDPAATMTGQSAVGVESLPTDEDVVANGLPDTHETEYPCLPPLGSNTTNLVPIAICGMAMRLPGGINTGQQLWDFLLSKRDARDAVPASRYNANGFFSTFTDGEPDDKREVGNTGLNYGYMLNDVDLAHFDASFFSMSRSELEWLDPQQRLLLELTRECLENAGELGWRGRDIGCYIGAWGDDWMQLQSLDTQDTNVYGITGHADAMLSNRISYEYDFKGPSMTIRTACSAALIGLHLAFKALQDGEICAAIVGGSNLILSPAPTEILLKQGVLSPHASCRAFDAEADGYARAEAINMVYLKRLDDALRDGNPIRAVIRSTASNCDGSTPGLTYPSTESHEALIRSCYRIGGIREPTETGFVECHGTGTRIGDPTETAAVANVFGQKGVYIGSVKPNLGHSEGASGITSLIKCVLALENNTIPPNIKFTKPNPRIPFKQSNLHVPVEEVSWPKDRLERVSINSFGIGGANAHVILDSANSFGIDQQSPQDLHQRGPKLLVFTANHAESVRKGVQNYTEFIETQPESIHDVAYTLANHREHLPYRAFAVADETSALKFSLPSKLPAQTPEVVFVFTGQGAQWHTMGVCLMSDYPSVMNDLELMDGALSKLGSGQAPSWTIRDELLKGAEVSRVSTPEFAQPLCTAIQLAVVNLLRRWGIQPTAVIGHSSGEIAAAYACGALSMQEAIINAYLRGYVIARHERPGAMASVGLSRASIKQYLVEGIGIACENSPENVTLSGDEEKIEIVLEAIAEANLDIFTRRLRVSAAYHSYHMKEVGCQYENIIRPHISSKQPAVPFFSSVSKETVNKKGQLDATYWRSNLENEVAFYPAMKELLSRNSSSKLLLEIGPHSALAGPSRQILASVPGAGSYVPTLIRFEDDSKALLTAIGQLFVQGISIDFKALIPVGRVLGNLPSYPWHHDSKYWHESRLSLDWRSGAFQRHDILGSRTLESNALEPSWRNLLRLDNVPWIRDHLIGPDILFPGSAYVAMACEAIRQISGTIDCSLREVTIDSAMILRESTTTETMFSMHPLRLTNTLDSTWYEFVVSSHNGSRWIKHCTGQIKPGSVTKPRPRKIVELPRKVPTALWYETMDREGLSYGPRFQVLENVSAHPLKNLIAAHIPVQNHADQESPYFIHPTDLDACIQLLPASAARGLSRQFTKKFVPTYLGEIYIRRQSGPLTLEASTDPPRENVRGTCIGLDKDGVALEMKDIVMTALSDGDDNNKDSSLDAVKLLWKPDISLLEVNSLIALGRSIEETDATVLQKLTFFCCVSLRDSLGKIITDAHPSHLHRFFDWLSLHIANTKLEGFPWASKANEFLTLPLAERRLFLTSYKENLSSTETRSMGEAILLVYTAIGGIADEGVDTFKFLHENAILPSLRGISHHWDCTAFLGLLSHHTPHLRILEINAGTGATTTRIFEGLRSEFGERMYYSYTYTDPSEDLVNIGKSKFKHIEAINFLPLDINGDAVAQDLGLGSFDLIIATHALCEAQDVGKVLLNARKLLKPDGRLLLQELCPSTKCINFAMGLDTSYWEYEADGKLNEPHNALRQWTRQLNEAGFATDEPIIDSENSFQDSAILIARPRVDIVSASFVSLLSRDPHSHVATALSTALTERGLNVKVIGLEDELSDDVGVISILDLEGGSYLEGISAEDYARLQQFMLKTTPAGMLWLTKPCQVRCEEPQYAVIMGLTRVLRGELGVNIATFEIDELGPTSSMDAIFNVYRKLQQATGDGEVDVDSEYSLLKGVVHIPRFHWFSINEELSSEISGPSFKRLEIGKFGMLNTLHWVDRPEEPLGDSEVLVEVRATGMNFKDYLIAMGIVTGDGLGCDLSGVVTYIGPKVSNLCVGDRIMAVAGNTFSTKAKVAADLCVKIPDDLGFEDAATMPLVYATAIHSLLNVGRLESGQTVLIHSACGGVGLAAIQLCRMVGAEIFATVSNEEKVTYLVDVCGIPQNRIFNSRESSDGFLSGIMRETDSRGVDLVLNSLSGEKLHDSWKCVAEYGTMVEIGKRDFIGQGRLAMELFEANRSFHGVELSNFAHNRPKVIGKLLERCVNFYRTGAIKPIRMSMLLEAADIEEGFRSMQKGRHIGKIILRMPDDQEQLASVPVRHDLRLRPDASYLLIGGLGGLGRSISTWMVECGARNLIYLSRSGGRGPNDADLVRELNAAGCTTQIIAGSVTNLEDVRRAIREARLPIAGVINASMVLRSGMFADMTHNDWEEALAPKVQGTWNLHTAFEETDLDFFVLFSSISGLVGPRGQANYAAGNTFLDAFVQYRHKQGLPASVIDIGAMGDVGIISESEKLLRQFRFAALKILREKDLLDALELAIKKSCPSFPASRNTIANGYICDSQFGMGVSSSMPLSSKQNYTTWKRDPRMSVYRNLEEAPEVTNESASDEDEELRKFLGAVRVDPRKLLEDASVVTLSRHIGLVLFRLTIRPEEDLDIMASTSALGIDSLVGIELHNWCRQRLGVRVSVLEIKSAESIKELGRFVAEELMVKWGVGKREGGTFSLLPAKE
ncbi:hypothetical protein F4805DRAFT_48404 [Annulohypoxylon moriforme]|nr:hypothetical protein F4805DRAFT_48404 [Annulohypoxylon moriforme]